MELRVFTEPQQGATYDQLPAVARRTEERGFDAFFRSDHYLAMGDIAGLPGPSDAWVTLAGLARETERIRLGTLVTAATFRLPGPLAIGVATVDQMSGGRVELGIGAGWYDEEHTAYGVPFPSLGERFDRLEEQLEIIGGFGPRRTPRLVARFGDEFNAPFCDAEISRRASAIGRDVDELRANGLAGTPTEVVAKLEEFAQAGVTRVYLQVLDLDDLDHLDLVAQAVLPAASELPGS